MMATDRELERENRHRRRGVQKVLRSDAFRKMMVTVEGQGGFMQMKQARGWQRGGGKRGNITKFSKASRRRLFIALAKVVSCDFRRGLWGHLTYPANFQDVVVSEEHLKEFDRRLRTRYPGLVMVWRRDRQKRGALHYHMILLHVDFIPKRAFQALWGSVIGEGRRDLQTRVAPLDSRRAATNYCAKYMTRVEEEDVSEGGPGRGAASAAACPAAAVGLEAVPVSYSRGRSWGIKGRKHLTEGIVVIGAGETTRRGLELARALGKAIWARVGKSDGFGLFVENGTKVGQMFCLVLGLRLGVCHSKPEMIELWLRAMEELGEIQMDRENIDMVVTS